MSPDKIESPRSAAGGSQDSVCLTANIVPLPQNATAAQEPVDRRTSLTGLSVAVRDVRIRLARNDIYDALCPVSRHSEAALLSLELDDDEGVEHHLRHIVDGIRSAALRYRELKALLSRPAPT